MALSNNTQDPNLEANPNNGATNQPEDNQGNQTTVPPVTNKEEKTYSQHQLDDIAAKTRGAAERDTKRKILAQLGLKDGEEEKLLAFKEAYEASLTDEEKRQTELANLQSQNTSLKANLEEKDYIIKALVELTGKNENDVNKIVKMAKGLKTDENSIEDAIKEVISMVNVTKPATQVVETVQPNPNMPTSEPLAQPSTSVVVDTSTNPFKAGEINLTEQGRLIRENPELARKLATEAGVQVRF